MPIERSNWALNTKRHALVQMEDLLHLCPPFTLFSRRERFLQLPHNSPPLLSPGVGGHPLPVCLQIIAVVFEVAEKKTVS